MQNGRTENGSGMRDEATIDAPRSTPLSRRAFVGGAVGGLLLVPGLMALASTPAAAQGDAETQRINAIINDLRPFSPPSQPEAGRGTRPGGEDPRNRPSVRRIVVPDPDGGSWTVWVDYDRQVSFQIQFEYNSARLTRSARKELRLLGQALRSPELRRSEYLLTGHTDTKGSREYNQRLSERRARSARRYLVSEQGVSRGQLLAAGFGEDRLADPSNPRSAINRRVVVGLIVARERGNADAPGAWSSNGAAGAQSGDAGDGSTLVPQAAGGESRFLKRKP